MLCSSLFSPPFLPTLLYLFPCFLFYIFTSFHIYSIVTSSSFLFQILPLGRWIYGFSFFFLLLAFFSSLYSGQRTLFSFFFFLLYSPSRHSSFFYWCSFLSKSPVLTSCSISQKCTRHVWLSCVSYLYNWGSVSVFGQWRSCFSSQRRGAF